MYPKGPILLIIYYLKCRESLDSVSTFSIDNQILRCRVRRELLLEREPSYTTLFSFIFGVKFTQTFLDFFCQTLCLFKKFIIFIMKYEDMEIIKEFKRYTQKVAGSLFQPEFVDDLIQVANIALVKYEHEYDEAKGTRRGYFTTIIKLEMMKFLSLNARTIYIPYQKLYCKDIDKRIHIPTISLSTPLNDEGDTVDSMIAGQEDYIAPEVNEALKMALSSLSDKDKDVIEKHLDLNDNSKPKTFAQLGIEYGITASGVQLRYKIAIGKLRKIMMENQKQY